MFGLLGKHTLCERDALAPFTSNLRLTLFDDHEFCNTEPAGNGEGTVTFDGFLCNDFDEEGGGLRAGIPPLLLSPEDKLLLLLITLWSMFALASFLPKCFSNSAINFGSNIFTGDFINSLSLLTLLLLYTI